MKQTTLSIDKGESLIRSYKHSQSQQDKDAAVKEYLPLVRHIVGRLNIPADGVLKREDLLQYGVLGLLDALERFRPELGVSFKTFAYKRIYGEVVDAVRRVGLLSREQTREVQLLAQTLDKLWNRLLREPTIEEVCQEAGITTEQYFRIEQTNHLNFTISLDESFRDSDGSSVTRKELIADQGEITPDEGLAKSSLKKTLKYLIEQLPERERLILALYYYEELTLSDIGQVLDLSESRVSQLLKSTLISIRQKLYQLV